MATVDPGYAAWLKADALYAATTVPGVEEKWGDRALDSKVVSPLATKAAAQSEADYQAAFLAGPLARDRIVVVGLRSNLIGRLVTINGDRLGYEGGADVFVIGAAESEGARITTLTVLKRMA